MMRLVLDLPIRAYPQGSKRAFVHQGRAVMTESSAKNVKAYRNAVAAAAAEKCAEPTRGPVVVQCRFTIPRPLSHYVGGKREPERLRDTAPSVCVGGKRGDIDKLLRSTLDALTGPCLADDDQVVRVSARIVWGHEPRTWIAVMGVG